MNVDLNPIKMVLSNVKYFIVFIVLSLLFSVVYIFSWNLILLSNFYVRYDLWTLSNIFFLSAISILSGIVSTLTIYNFRIVKKAKHTRSYFSIVPAFFASACPTCAPLLLSFSSVTIGLGFFLARFNVIVKSLVIIFLVMALLRISSVVGKCRIK